MDSWVSRFYEAGDVLSSQCGRTTPQILSAATTSSG